MPQSWSCTSMAFLSDTQIMMIACRDLWWKSKCLHRAQLFYFLFFVSNCLTVLWCRLVCVKAHAYFASSRLNNRLARFYTSSRWQVMSISCCRSLSDCPTLLCSFLSRLVSSCLIRSRDQHCLDPPCIGGIGKPTIGLHCRNNRKSTWELESPHCLDPNPCARILASPNMLSTGWRLPVPQWQPDSNQSSVLWYLHELDRPKRWSTSRRSLRAHTLLSASGPPRHSCL